MKRYVKSGLAVLLSAILLTVTACSGNNGAANSPESSASPSASEASSPEAIDPLGKYDPPIELTTIRSIGAEQAYDPGENIDKNTIYDYYEQKLGIKIKNNWTVNNEYDAKLKIAIASNDLPDFFKVSAADLPTLIENDMIMDITEIWDKTASPDTKSEFTKDGGRQIKTATFNGKMMAIPQTDSPYNSMNYVWVRKDWLKELNLPEPKTMTDLFQISEAFAKRDTGGNGKAYGLSLSKLLNLSGYFAGYHLYPKQWVKDASGNLIYGSLDPNMKTALQQLQDMFKAGQIDPEFGVKDESKELEMIANDRVGLLYGAFWHSAAFGSAVKDDKLVQDWGVYPIPSIDDNPALSLTSAAVSNYYVINKKAKNPEAVIKLLNLWIDYVLHPNEENNVLVFGQAHKDTGKFFWEINPVVAFSQDANVQSGDLIPRALATGDTSLLGTDVDRNSRYEAVKKYLEGEVTFPNWLQYMIAGEGGSMALMFDAYNKDLFHFNEFSGAPTPTMGDKMSVLNAKEDEVVTKIIMGALSVDEYDNFISEWKKLGGDQITVEVNEWYKSQQ
ncbi:extracellular solute-binding protein [Paenibacillus sp. PAMC21692]|uniref:extracellular solute-binding protein n=1 Tax=Paenibacillus sp. PAMC21692 TaxID=2762320 RepID=UPI00164DFE95|nr:extracellular solute-binding protein [Paenibacillus sp. PAMC21692]QNK56835.1 extracellular solute-binding protein [Paenibacillus sp. PAMC21692]